MTWQLCEGRAEQILPGLPAESFDLVHLDPPYFPHARFDIPSRGKQKEKVDGEPVWHVLRDELSRVLKPDGIMLLWGGEPHMSLMRHYLFKDYIFHSELVWVKNRPNLLVSWKHPPRAHEKVWVLLRSRESMKRLSLRRTSNRQAIRDHIFSKLHYRRLGGPRSQTYGEKLPNTQQLPLKRALSVLSSVMASPQIISGNPEYLGHPTQKPLSLTKDLVSFTTMPNARVLDPMCGSGTTLLACEMLGRNSVGVELNPKYARLARERIEAYNGHGLSN